MKRKFKILILTISVIAMLFAFAVTSSAWSNSNPGDSGSVDEDYWYIYDVHTTKYYGYAFTSHDLSGIEISLDYFGILNDGVIEDLNEEIASGSEVGINLYHSSDSLDPDRFSKNNRFIREEVKLAFEQAYAEFEALLEKEYTQTDLDNAVSEATKDMYTQEQLSEAVAKALKEGNLNPNNYLVYIPSDATVADVAEGTEESFVAQELVEGSFSYFVVFLNGGHMEKIVVANALEFQEFCKKYEITDLSSLMTKVAELQEIVTYDNYEAYEWLNSLSVWSESLFDFFYNYDPLTQEEYEAELNAEKLAGAEEYKSSEEYINALNNKYSTGYTEGVEAFKASDAYADALDLQFTNGKTAGVNDFKASVEFKNTLKAQYNEGYDNGVTDTQGENTKNETTKLISILIGVAGFGILFMAVLSAVGVFKKKRAKRR
ncbi:MAG: hypothetical protein IJZ04_01545 [Clostridia bacterium]|nr:hypothetical protein [Clostridia bacterium]